MIRFIWCGWSSLRWGFKRERVNFLGYRGVFYFGPLTVDFWCRAK